MTRPKPNPAIEADFLDAIERLREEGASVTFASVARRAGHSRTLISQSTSAYVTARRRICEIRAEVAPRAPSPVRRLDRRTVDLNKENTFLRAQIRQRDASLARAASTMAALLAASMTRGREHAREVSREQRRAARMKARGVDGAPDIFSPDGDGA